MFTSLFSDVSKPYHISKDIVLPILICPFEISDHEGCSKPTWIAN